MSEQKRPELTKISRRSLLSLTAEAVATTALAACESKLPKFPSPQPSPPPPEETKEETIKQKMAELRKQTETAEKQRGEIESALKALKGLKEIEVLFVNPNNRLEKKSYEIICSSGLKLRYSPFEIKETETGIAFSPGKILQDIQYLIKYKENNIEYRWAAIRPTELKFPGTGLTESQVDALKQKALEVGQQKYLFFCVRKGDEILTDEIITK